MVVSSVSHASEIQGGMGAAPPARGSTPAPRFPYLIYMGKAISNDVWVEIEALQPW